MSAPEKVWIRRGFGAFVRVKNRAKAWKRATHWWKTGQGDPGFQAAGPHRVIGMFVNGFNKEHRTQLYP